MRHKRYEELIVLSRYDEIGRDDEASLENHLKQCPSCSKLSRQLDELLPKVDARPEMDIEQLIQEARSRVRNFLTRKKNQKAGRAGYADSQSRQRWINSLTPAYEVAGVALVALAAGVISGYLIFGGRYGAQSVRNVVSEISAKGAGAAAITDVRFLEGETASGNLKFSFNVVKPYEVEGSIDNRNIQKILAYALVNSDNPGVRLKTIGMIDASGRPDREIEDALIRAVKSDDNAGVRREALVSLDKLPFNNNIKEAMLYVLQHDKNPGMRVAAINFLAGKELRRGSLAANSRVDPQVLNVLREKSTSDQNRYVRLKAKDMLKELKEL